MSLAALSVLFAAIFAALNTGLLFARRLVPVLGDFYLPTFLPAAFGVVALFAARALTGATINVGVIAWLAIVFVVIATIVAAFPLLLTMNASTGARVFLPALIGNLFVQIPAALIFAIASFALLRGKESALT